MLFKCCSSLGISQYWDERSQRMRIWHAQATNRKVCLFILTYLMWSARVFEEMLRRKVR